MGCTRFGIMKFECMLIIIAMHEVYATYMKLYNHSAFYFHGFLLVLPLFNYNNWKNHYYCITSSKASNISMLG